MVPPPVEIRDRLPGKAVDHPSADALENLARAVLQLLDNCRDDVASIVQVSLSLSTPKLQALLGFSQDDAPWRLVKHERYNRKCGRAIAPEKGILYTLVVLDACNAFTYVADDYWNHNDKIVVIDMITARNREASPRDIQRRRTVSDFDERAKPVVFATLDAWEDYVTRLGSCGPEIVKLAVSVDLLSSNRMLRALGGFVEELFEHNSKTAMSNAGRKGTLDELANAIGRHHRIHDPHDVNWMVDRWDAVRDMIDRSIAAGNLDLIARTGPILTHFSYVFEGSRPLDDRLRVKIAKCLQAQVGNVPPDVALFERIEGQGFVSLEANDFSSLSFLAGEDAFRENDVRIQETIRSLERQNRDPRLALVARASLYRLRAHVLGNQTQLKDAESMFRRSADQAALAKNESLQSAVLIDGARSLLAQPYHIAQLRAFEDQIKAAEALSWRNYGRPNWLRLTELHLALAEVYASINRHEDAVLNLNKAQGSWLCAQPKSGKHKYRFELLGRVNELRARINGAQASGVNDSNSRWRARR